MSVTTDESLWWLTETGDPDLLILEISFDASLDDEALALETARRKLDNCGVVMKHSMTDLDGRVYVYEVECRTDYVRRSDGRKVVPNLTNS